MKRIETFFKYFMRLIVIVLVVIAAKNLTTIYQQSMAKNMTETPQVKKIDIDELSKKQKVLVVFFKPNTEMEKVLKPKFQDYLSTVTLQQRPKIIYINSESENGTKLEKQYNIPDFGSYYLLPISNMKVQEKIKGKSVQELNESLVANNQVNEELLKEILNDNWEA